MREPAPPQGGEHLPHGGELRVGDGVAELGEAATRRVGVGEARGEGADLADRERPRCGDAGVGEREGHEGAVLDLGAQVERRGAGARAAQPQHPPEPSPGGEAEGVPVEDLHVELAGGGDRAVGPLPRVVRVLEQQPAHLEPRPAQGERHVGAGRPGRHRAEAVAHREPDAPAEQQRDDDGEAGALAGREGRHRRRGDDDDGDRLHPAAAADVGDGDEGGERDEHGVGGRRAPLRRRPGQRGQQAGDVPLEDEGAQPEDEQRADARGDERLDELARPRAHEQVGADDERQDDDGEARDPGDDWSSSRGAPPVARLRSDSRAPAVPTARSASATATTSTATATTRRRRSAGRRTRSGLGARRPRPAGGRPGRSAARPRPPG